MQVPWSAMWKNYYYLKKTDRDNAGYADLKLCNNLSILNSSFERISKEMYYQLGEHEVDIKSMS